MTLLKIHFLDDNVRLHRADMMLNDLDMGKGISHLPILAASFNLRCIACMLQIRLDELNHALKLWISWGATCNKDSKQDIRGHQFVSFCVFCVFFFIFLFPILTGFFLCHNIVTKTDVLLRFHTNTELLRFKIVYYNLLPYFYPCFLIYV